MKNHERNKRIKRSHSSGGTMFLLVWDHLMQCCCRILRSVRATQDLIKYR